jgi:hypothetical protein
MKYSSEFLYKEEGSPSTLRPFDSAQGTNQGEGRRKEEEERRNNSKDFRD